MFLRYVMLQLFVVTVYGTRNVIFHDKHFVLLLYFITSIIISLCLSVIEKCFA
jgi:hypothetical protein